MTESRKLFATVMAVLASGFLLLAVLLSSSLGSVATVAETGKDYKAIYQRTCIACHSSGAGGAPRTGDKAAWAERIAAKGEDTLVENSLKGIGSMPPGGLCGDCSADDMRALIRIMAN